MQKNLRLYAFLVGLMSCPSPDAFAMEERITLLLSGSACAENRQGIEHALKEIHGVHRADFLAVPDHILVDIETGTVTAEVLQDRGNDALAAYGSCRVEIMKSCITADPRSASMRAP